MAMQSEASMAAPAAVPAHVTVQQSTRYSWFVAGILMMLYTLSYIDRTIPSLLVDPIRADFQINDTQYSLLIGFAFVITYSVAGIPFGWLVDQWTRRGVIAFGVTFWSLATAACGMANNYGTLLAARIGVGVGEASINPAAMSMITDYFKKEQLSRAMSLYFSGTPIGTGLALMIGGTVLEMATAAGPQDWPLIGTIKPWQVVFMMVGLPGILLAILFLMLVREPARREVVKTTVKDEAPTLSETLKYIWSNRSLYVTITMGVSLTTLFGYGTNAWYPAFLIRVHEFSPVQTGLILGISIVVLGIIGAMTAGWWSDWLVARGRKDAQLIVGMWYATGLIVFGAMGALIPIAWLSVTFLAISCLFIKTLSGIMAGAITLVTPNRMRGRISAVYLCVIAFIAQGFGPLSVAASTDYIFGYDAAVGYSLGLVGVVACSIAIVCFYLGRKHLIARLANA
jgi:MFS family permease